MQEAIKGNEAEVRKARGLKDAAEAARWEAEEKLRKAQQAYEDAHVRAHPVIDVAAVAAKAKAAVVEEEESAKKKAAEPKEADTPKGEKAKKKRGGSTSPARGGRSSR